jgi:hypothetical protein
MPSFTGKLESNGKVVADNIQGNYDAPATSSTRYSVARAHMDTATA